MNKVILTQEQAEAIKYFRKDACMSNHVIIYNLVYYDVTGRSGIEDYRKLEGIDLDKLICALYIGYEVKPTFKIGDWATHKLTGDVGVIKLVNDESIRCDNGMGGWINDFRHATPEEIAEEKNRRLFSRYGRKVWELRKNDILYNPWLGIRTVFHIRDSGKVSFAEDHKEYEIDEIKESYRVACFAENRLDVKDDE